MYLGGIVSQVIYIIITSVISKQTQIYVYCRMIFNMYVQLWSLFFPVFKIADLICLFSFHFFLHIFNVLLISKVGCLAVTVIETKLPFYLHSGVWTIHFDLTFFRGNILPSFSSFVWHVNISIITQKCLLSLYCFIAHLFYLPLKIIQCEHSRILSGSKPLLFQNGKICLLEVSLDVLNNTKEVIKLEVERT